MKKVLLVLALGLGLVSCSKESIPEEPIQEYCLDLITGLRYDYFGCDCYQLITINQETEEEIVWLIDESTYAHYRNQYLNDLSMCFDGYH
tara:strand:- start:3885 stop:4154 length:270 start_codon:yes stop_codon:yes gene_type:complete